MEISPEQKAVIAELKYRDLVKKFLPSLADQRVMVVVAAEVCKRTGIQPSEFMRLSVGKRSQLLEWLIGLPVSSTPADDLTDSEQTILEAVGDKTLSGPALAEASGFPNNSAFRTRLSHMVKRGLLEKVPHKGYRRKG